MLHTQHFAHTFSAYGYARAQWNLYIELAQR